MSKRHMIDQYIEEITACLAALDLDAIVAAINHLLAVKRKKKHVFILGNGGSASTASHMVCDLARLGINVSALSDNVAMLTAYGNDISYDAVFVEQLRYTLEKGDLVIVLSVSGDSKNLIKAVRFAKRKKAYTIGFLGRHTGGVLGRLVDTKIVVQSQKYGPCEDIHLILNHIVATVIQSNS